HPTNWPAHWTVLSLQAQLVIPAQARRRAALSTSWPFLLRLPRPQRPLLPLQPAQPSCEKAGRQTLQRQPQIRRATAISSRPACPAPPESLRPRTPRRRLPGRLGPVGPDPSPPLRYRLVPCPKHSRPLEFRPERPAAGTDSSPALVLAPKTRHHWPACSVELRAEAFLPDKSSESSAPRCCSDTGHRRSNAPNCCPGETRMRSNSDSSSCRWEVVVRAFLPARPRPLFPVLLVPAGQSQTFHPSGNTFVAVATCSRPDILPRPSGSRRWAGRSRSATERQSSWDPWRVRRCPIARWRCCCPAAPRH